MADQRIPVTKSDTLWGLQQSTGVDWRQMKVERNGTLYSLKKGLGDLPGGALHPGDSVLLPSSCEDDDKCENDAANTMNELSSSGPPAASKQGDNAKNASANASTEQVTAVQTCNAKLIFVLDPGHGGRAAVKKWVTEGAKKRIAESEKAEKRIVEIDAKMKAISEKLESTSITIEERKKELSQLSSLSLEKVSLKGKILGSYASISGTEKLGSRKRGESSFNNAIGAVSNILEKRMTHKLIPLIKKELEMQKEKLKKEDSITSIEVHVTKTDEYINLGGFERAAVGKDKAADFFFSVHFNAATGEKAPEVFLDITKVSGTVDKSYRVYIHQLDKENFGGHYDKSAANYKNPARGPQMLIRGDFPTDIQSKCELISQNLKSEFSKFIYETEYGDNKGSFDSIGDSPEGTANVSPTYLGVTNPDAKKIIPIYLEADFINVESGDRLWNTKEYHQNIKACRARWKTPPEPEHPPKLMDLFTLLSEEERKEHELKLKKHEQWKKDNLLKVLPDLKVDHDMFKLSAKKIAEVLFNNRHHRLCS